MGPLPALNVVVISGMIGQLLILPNAVKNAQKKVVSFYGIGIFIGVYLGLFFLFSLFSFVSGQQVCVGDINNSNTVDVNDLLGVLTRFSESGDLNEDINKKMLTRFKTSKHFFVGKV